MTKMPTAATAEHAADTMLRNSDCASLAKEAVARLCADVRQADKNGQVASVLGSPLAAALAYALCDEDSRAANLIVEDLLEAGVSVEEICLDHLAPAARRLGEWWDSDRLPFTEVTLAAARIQSMLRRMPAAGVTGYGANDLAALFVAVPGEHHTLGVIMATDMFRRSGWDVGLVVGEDHGAIMQRVLRDSHPVIGLSCSGDHSFPALKRLLAEISRDRPDARILLSGHIVEHPERLADLDGDFDVIADKAGAVSIMQTLRSDIQAGAASAQRMSG